MEEAIKKILAEAESRMQKCVEATVHEMAGVRTGRASPALLDGIRVEYYGTLYQLKQLATITTPEPRLIVVQPWDQKMIDPIQRAIMKSDVGINPSTDGKVIRLPVPTLTEERRREMVKLVHKRAEHGRVSIRNVRREAQEGLRRLKEEGGVSEDAVERARESLNKITEKYVGEVDRLSSNKEKEVMEG